MAISSNEFKEKVGQKLGILATSESLSAEDGALIGDKMDALERMLGEREIVQVSFADEIDVIFMEPLVAMVAAMCVDEFGVQGQERADLLNGGLLDLPVSSHAERQLRKIVAKKPIRTVKVDYF